MAGSGTTGQAKGPLVYLDYDQAALDAAYDQAAYAPNIEQVLARYTSESARMRARLGAPERVAYGPSDIEKLDIFRAAGRDAPVLVFIHGGGWRRGLASDYAFPAATAVAAGAHYVALDFVSVVDAGGKLVPLAEQVRRAIAWVYRNAGSFGGDPGRIHVVGHSSGAHLASVALTTDWRVLGLPDDIIKSGLCISGMYELAPVRLSARSAYVKFDDASVDELSAMRHLDRLRAPVIVAHGSLETPEFQRQARDFVAALQAAGKPVEAVRAEHYNHFEIAETLASPHGVLGSAMLRQMGLA